MYNLIVRWTDKKGIEQKKRYEDMTQARKAAKWLDENGATDVDIAAAIVTPIEVENYNEKN